MRGLKPFLLAVALAALIGSAQAAEKAAKQPPMPIEIKGLFIGMTTRQYIDLPNAEQTIGGVRAKGGSSDGFALEWNAGKLESLQFVFKPDGFEDVVRAIKGKYPKLSCTDSSVRNSVGGVFTQRTCLHKQAGASLFVQRYSGDLETSILMLQSEEVLERFRKTQEKKASDI